MHGAGLLTCNCVFILQRALYKPTAEIFDGSRLVSGKSTRRIYIIAQQVSLAGECRIGFSTAGIYCSIVDCCVVLEIVIMADKVSKPHAFIIVLHKVSLKFPTISSLDRGELINV